MTIVEIERVCYQSTRAYRESMTQFTVSIYDRNRPHDPWCAESRQQFNKKEEAFTYYKQVCQTLREFPSNLICALERDGLAVKAHRCTRSCELLGIDVRSDSFLKLVVQCAKNKFTYPQPSEVEATSYIPSPSSAASPFSRPDVQRAKAKLTAFPSAGELSSLQSSSGQSLSAQKERRDLPPDLSSETSRSRLGNASAGLQPAPSSAILPEQQLLNSKPSAFASTGELSSPPSSSAAVNPPRGERRNLTSDISREGSRSKLGSSSAQNSGNLPTQCERADSGQSKGGSPKPSAREISLRDLAQTSSPSCSRSPSGKESLRHRKKPSEDLITTESTPSAIPESEIPHLRALALEKGYDESELVRRSLKLPKRGLFKRAQGAVKGLLGKSDREMASSKAPLARKSRQSKDT